jgi:hypothetical protein
MVPEDLPFQFIKEITDDFSEHHILGAGTFGIVYKVRFGHAQFSYYVWPTKTV